jgi:hypothetical protein
MLTWYLRDGTEYLSASTVRRVIQVASMSAVGSAIAISRLNKEVHRVTTTYPDEDPVTLADHMVRMCEEEVLDWMRTRTVDPGPDASSPVTSALQTQSGTPSLQRPGQRGSSHQRPNQRALSRLGLSHQRLSPRILTHRRPSQRTPTHLTWRRGEGVRSPPTRAILTLPPPPPPIQRSRTLAALTQALQSRLHPTPREISPLRHHPLKRLRSLAEK